MLTVRCQVVTPFAVNMLSSHIVCKSTDVSEEPAYSVVRVDVDPDFGGVSDHITMVCF